LMPAADCRGLLLPHSSSTCWKVMPAASSVSTPISSNRSACLPSMPSEMVSLSCVHGSVCGKGGGGEGRAQQMLLLMMTDN
jgi:hypothetical protein